MKLLVILGHPDPWSFNHAIASTVCETLRKSGHTVILHDLYAEGFDPLLPSKWPRGRDLPCGKMMGASFFAGDKIPFVLELFSPQDRGERLGRESLPYPRPLDRGERA